MMDPGSAAAGRKMQVRADVFEFGPIQVDIGRGPIATDGDAQWMFAEQQRSTHISSSLQFVGNPSV